MKKFAAGVVVVLALTGCAAAGPEAPPAPVGIASEAITTASASAVPDESETPTAEPVESTFPDASESDFLRMAHRDWEGAPVPADAALLDAGYEVCAGIAEERVFDDDRFPEWSGQNNFVMHFAAEYHLCPAQ